MIKSYQQSPVQQALGPMFGKVFRRHRQDSVKPRKYPLIGCEHWILRRIQTRVRRGISVPNQGRIITQFSELQRDVGMTCIERYSIFNRSVVLEVHSGVKRCPARAAWCALSKVVSEENTVGSKSIKTRRFNSGVP